MNLAISPFWASGHHQEYRVPRAFGYYVTVLLLVIAAGCGKTAKSSYVVYLVDVSKSFAPLQDNDRHALLTLSEVISERATNDWDPPVGFYWTTTTRFDAGSPEPCGPAIEYHPSLVKARPDEITTDKRLRAWHAACIERLTGAAVVPVDFTDISGAIARVTASTRNVPGTKLLVILSDFDEDLPPMRTPAVFSLADHDVILLPRPSHADAATDPNLAEERALRWADRFRSCGARSVHSIPVIGISRQMAAACIDEVARPRVASPERPR